MNPVDVLRDGAGELAAILDQHGFQFVETDSGRGSGGPFAAGEFRRDDRRLELHFRYSLGLVAYHVGTDSLDHADLIRSVSASEAIQESPRYPGFSEDPLDGFRHLRADLVRFGAVFTHGSSSDFAVLAAWVRQNPVPRGLAALP